MNNIYKILAFILGFSCFVVQLVLIRLFLNMFMGNELVIGTTLALWMLLTATGAWLGHHFYPALRKSSRTSILLLATGIFPLAGIVLAFLVKTALFVPGVMVSLQGVLLISTAGLSLFCLASGMLFTFLATGYSEKEGRNNIALIYAIEAVGSLAGGVLFNFVLVYYASTAFILASVLVLNLLATALYLYSVRKKALAGILLLAIIPAAIFFYHVNIRQYINNNNYPGREIIQTSQTPFGELVVSSRAGQVDILLGGNVVGAAGDLILREEKIHYPISLHPGPADVLMLYGGLDGALNEITKYNIRCIDYVDPDPWAVKAAEKYFGLDFPDGVCVHYEDPVHFLRTQEQLYDVILYCGPPPSTIGNNRFYTSEFFACCRKSLHKNGILSLQMPPPGNYLDEHTNRLYSSIYNSLKASFTYIRIIPGEHCFFIASQEPVDGSIIENISTKGLLNDYVNVFYIDEQLLNRRADAIAAALDPGARANSRMHPLAAYQSVLLWLHMFSLPLWLVILLPLLAMMAYLLRLSPYNLGMFSTGFTASAAEFLALVVFQTLYGFVYQLAGLFIMIFMAGLALGAGIAPFSKHPKKKFFVANQVILGVLTLILPLLLVMDDRYGTTMLVAVLTGVFTFVVAVMTGIQFNYATSLRKASGSLLASSAYGADLAGSAFGLFLISVFVFPVLGLMNTVLILAGVNLVTAGLIHLRSE
ncbi:MAG: hypothetical protein V2I47_02645 [Bacteroidales bacterium]|jgi:spermidine synthase|nr:hypothetical protein [Bacteroidales bacterium]